MSGRIKMYKVIFQDQALPQTEIINMSKNQLRDKSNYYGVFCKVNKKIKTLN